VGGIVVKWLVTAPFILKIAAMPLAVAIGATPMGIAGVGGILATALGTYAATHIAELQEAGVFLQAIQSIKSVPDYDIHKNGEKDNTPVAEGQSNSNINQG
jgi:hypothetical protein